MKRAAALLLALAAACSKPRPPPLEACLPIPAAADAGPGVVWGMADLHAHPAIERAFSGVLIWGTAIDSAPVSPAELPRIAGCPVETHTQPGASPIDRAIGDQLFPEVAAIAGFAHGPVGSDDGLRPTDAWPNARDVIHQQMNVASIRRAYEGGLRLMFASTTDDQVIAALLTGPNFVNAFRPKAEADYESAKLQLDQLHQMVRDNVDWMGVALTPADARNIISQGKLALVISLENNGLRPGDLERLHDDYGARHVFPIHLADNDIGGTAANASLFNSSSAAHSSIYRDGGEPMRFMDVTPTRDYPSPLGRPATFATLSPAPVYVGLEDVPFRTWEALCYEPLAACTVPAPVLTTFTQLGQQNLRGLCSSREECLDGGRPGIGRIAAMMDAGWLIDLSHMSARATAETLAIAPGAEYPLIASHSDVVHLCRGVEDSGCTDALEDTPLTERQLDGQAARELVRRGGVLGLGLGVGNYSTRPVLVARAAPLFTLAPGAATACATTTPEGGCERIVPADGFDPAAPIEWLRLETSGGVLPNTFNAHPFARFELRDAVGAGEFQRRVVMAPLDCTAQACLADVFVGKRDGPFALPPSSCTAASCTGSTCGQREWTADDVEKVTLQWLLLACDAGTCLGYHQVRDRQCASTLEGGPQWAIESVAVSARSASASVTLASLGPRSPAPLATLGGNAGTFTVFDRTDRPSVSARVRASGHLLKVTAVASAASAALPGASSQRVGPNVCVAVRSRAGSACPAVTPPAPDATECPAGWTTLNQRGAWSPGVALYTFVRFAGDERDVCGVELTVLDWEKRGAPFSIESIRVDAAEDPVRHWVRRYAELSRHLAGSRLGVIALGTDFNGLNGMMDLSEDPVPAGAMLPSACAVTQGGGPKPAAVAPMRLRNSDGSLGGEVRIDERGLATYGLLQDFVAIAATVPGCGDDVRDSLMLSAEVTLRAWEKALNPSITWPDLPVRPFACDGGP